MTSPPRVEALSLQEKVAQMIFPRFNFGDPDFDEVRELIKLGVGGVLIFKGSIFDVGSTVNSFQRLSRIPLLMCADFEDGAGTMVGGATALPSNMAIGATRSEQHARRKGLITARESRAMGIPLVLAPVMDVNTDASNPIINIRAFGDDPGLVSRLGRAFIEGCHDARALACTKHFPGHGSTVRDSHIELPVVKKTRAELEAVELKPFRDTAAVADAVMTAHLSVPELDARNPASVSPQVTNDLLRKEMGFRGLIITDALMMGGIAKEMNEEDALIRAVLAGADVLLYPRAPRAAIAVLVRAVEEKKIPVGMIDQAAKRILAAKTGVTLFDDPIVPVERIEEWLQKGEHQRWAQEMAEEAITLVRDDGGLLARWGGRHPIHVIHIPSSTEKRASGLEQTLREGGVTVEPGLPDRAEAWCLLALHHRPRAYKDSAAVKADDLAIIQRVMAVTKNVIAVSLGSPYLPPELSSLPCYIGAYSECEASQCAAARAVLGRIPMKGQLPVTL